MMDVLNLAHDPHCLRCTLNEFNPNSLSIGLPLYPFLPFDPFFFFAVDGPWAVYGSIVLINGRKCARSS